MKRHRQFQAERILRVSRVVSDLDRAEAFYRDGLGFAPSREDTPTWRRWRLSAGLMPMPMEIVMRLGAQDIALVRFATQGRPYPRDSRSDDLWFQHLAIVVNDMDLAYAHLSSHAGWRPISEGGPQLLPPCNGAVRAFKFRDPDGHPLELIWFPPGQGRSVAQESLRRAVPRHRPHRAFRRFYVAQPAFYRALGLRVTERSLNQGPAQERLDGVPGARVRVTGLRPVSAAGPGLELLGYRPSGRAAGIVFPNDLMTDWITLAVRPSSDHSSCAIQDPDGHRLVLVDQGVGAMGLPA